MRGDEKSDALRQVTVASDEPGIPGAHTRLIRPDDASEIAQLLRRNRAFFEQWVPARSEDHFTASGQQEEIQIALAALSNGKAMPRSRRSARLPLKSSNSTASRP
jgi:hypothetical protein